MNAQTTFAESTTVLPLEKQHLKALDGVRGLAVLMVILWHAMESNFLTASPLIKVIGMTLYVGRLGVDLFFVLSGFLITGILIDTRGDSGYFRRFLARRALRIFPLYYGVLFVLMALTIPLHLKWNGMLPLLLLYLQNLRPYAIDHLYLSPQIALYHLWSLAVEEQFYIAWVVVVYWLRGGEKLIWGTAAGIVLAIAIRTMLLANGVEWILIHVSTPTRADTLLMGSALAIAFRSASWKRLQSIAPFAFVALLPAVLLPKDIVPAFFPSVRETMIAGCFAALIAWSLQPASAPSWIFERRWLLFLGKYSYGIYILHVFVMGPLNPILRRHLNDWTHSKLASVVVSAGVCLFLSILAAYVSFHVYEKRFLRLKRYFAYDRVPAHD